MNFYSRIVLLATAVLAAYQIAVGIDGLRHWAVASFTIAFGTLLVVVLLFLIMGDELLVSPWFPSLATLIPLSLSLGLVLQHAPQYSGGYLVFSIFGLVSVGVLPIFSSKRHTNQILAFVRGFAVAVIIFLPFVLVLRGSVQPGYSLVGVGGIFIAAGARLYSRHFSNGANRSREEIQNLLPLHLLLMMVAFLVGFAQY
jgi:hypothetical protein